jgi:hypothetical protein
LPLRMGRGRVERLADDLGRADVAGAEIYSLSE